MSQDTYVVIGSNCFTGSHIVDELLKSGNKKVIGISRSPEYKSLYLPYKNRGESQSHFSFHQIDLVAQFDKLEALLEKTKPQIVINVAALSEVVLSNDRPVEYFETNTLAIVKLCNYLRKTDYLKHYVHISSAEIFGSCQKPVTEEVLFNPSTPYAVSKAAADLYMNALIKNFRFPAILIRSTNVYGKHQQLFKIIPRTVIYLKTGKIIELHGGGKAIKSFVHIRDVVHGMMLAIKRGEPGTYHFSVPSEDTVSNVVHKICKLMGRDPNRATRVVGERLGQDARYWLDCEKAQKELGWNVQVHFEEGLREVIEWIESNWETVLGEPLTYIHKWSAK